MKKINLVLVKGNLEFGGIDNLMNEYLIEFGITDLPQSDPVFLDKLKDLVGFYAYNFFDMDFDESESLLEKAKTLEEIEAIAKGIKYDGYSEFAMTYGIEIIEIKNEVLLKGLMHLPDSRFFDEYYVDKEVEKFKEEGKFKEALELKESFDRLKDLAKSNPKAVSKTELERITELTRRVPSHLWPESLKKEYQEIIEKYTDPKNHFFL